MQFACPSRGLVCYLFRGRAEPVCAQEGFCWFANLSQDLSAQAPGALISHLPGGHPGHQTLGCSTPTSLLWNSVLTQGNGPVGIWKEPESLSFHNTIHTIEKIPVWLYQEKWKHLFCWLLMERERNQLWHMKEGSLFFRCAGHCSMQCYFTLDNTYHYALCKTQLYKSTWIELSSVLTDV